MKIQEKEMPSKYVIMPLFFLSNLISPSVALPNVFILCTVRVNSIKPTNQRSRNNICRKKFYIYEFF